MVKTLMDVVEDASSRVKLNDDDMVIDIGSNDGTLLTFYQNKITKVGFEPSNLVKYTPEMQNSIIINDFFNYETFILKIGNKKAKIITSIAMFYDLDDPNKFVEDIRACLSEDGLWIIQMNYLGLMIKNQTFDNISHEHLEYYSLLSLDYLLSKHRLRIDDVELNDVNGGSFKIYVRHASSSENPNRSSLEMLKNKEKKERLDKKETYVEFAKKIKLLKSDTLRFLHNVTKEGKKVMIFGASTRGLVMLQYMGIDKATIRYATDKNKDKFNRYIADTGIKILPYGSYRAEAPDYLLVLPYQFIREFVNQESDFLAGGGKLITLVPKLKVYGDLNDVK